jgi:hypothetical protein
MRRSYLFVVLIAAVLAVSLVVWRAGPTAARPGEDRTPPPAPVPANPLPLAQVILFNSGVGYFQREGTIEGDAHVKLQFPITDINDLLKSLIVQDSKGKVVAVSYEGQEPVERTLKSFPLDLTFNPTLGQIHDPGLQDGKAPRRPLRGQSGGLAVFLSERGRLARTSLSARKTDTARFFFHANTVRRPINGTEHSTGPAASATLLFGSDDERQ